MRQAIDDIDVRPRWRHGVVDDNGNTDGTYAGRIVISWGQYTEVTNGRNGIVPMTCTVTDYDDGRAYPAIRKLVIADCDVPVITVDLTMICDHQGFPLTDSSVIVGVGDDGKPVEQTWRFIVAQMLPLHYLDPTVSCSCPVIAGGHIVHHPWCKRSKET